MTRLFDINDWVSWFCDCEGVKGTGVDVVRTCFPVLLVGIHGLIEPIFRLVDGSSSSNPWTTKPVLPKSLFWFRKQTWNIFVQQTNFWRCDDSTKESSWPPFMTRLWQEPLSSFSTYLPIIKNLSWFVVSSTIKMILNVNKRRIYYYVGHFDKPCLQQKHIHCRKL